MKRSELLFRGLKKLFSSERGKWKVVTLCILGATTFWFFNALNKQYATRLNYPVEFLFDEENVVVVEELPQRVSIVVSGGGWNLLRKTLWFKVNPIQILLESPTTQKFITKASLTAIIADQLNEVRLNYVVTDTLFVNIEPLLSKKVRVHIDSTSIALAEGYRVVSPISTTPDSVLFRGPASYIRDLADSIVVFVPANQISSDYQGLVPIEDFESRIVSVEPDAVMVNFEVDEFTQQNRLVPIRAVNFPAVGNVQLKDTVAKVSYWVSNANADKLPPGSFTVVANYSDLNRSDSSIVLELQKAPPQVDRTQIEPAAAKIQYVPRKNRR